MLICKYTRLGNASFVPHLDMLRSITMGVRRIGTDAEYSEGFNPHMKIFFGQPLPIGVESECEYFCIFVRDDPSEFMKKLNNSLPDGVRITAADSVEKDPNVANLMAFADYTVTMRDIVPRLQAVESFAEQEICEIEYTAKGKTQRKDVKELIAQMRAVNDKELHLRLRCGNRNLRADRLMDALCKQYNLPCGYDIVKTAMYDGNGTNLDKVLFGSKHS